MFTETVVIHALDGVALTGELRVPQRHRGAMVVCHPHPLFGGDMDNPVVTALCGAANEAGFATVRFDFRGVRRSEGTHDEGTGERLDAAAAIDEVAPYAGDGPLVLAGYSFGALVALSVVDPRLDAWVAIAPPLGRSHGVAPLSATDHRAKLVLGPEHDQYTPLDRWTEATAAWHATTFEVVAGADHFLVGNTRRVADAAVAFSLALEI